MAFVKTFSADHTQAPSILVLLQTSKHDFLQIKNSSPSYHHQTHIPKKQKQLKEEGQAHSFPILVIIQTVNASVTLTFHWPKMCHRTTSSFKEIWER